MIDVAWLPIGATTALAALLGLGWAREAIQHRRTADDLLELRLAANNLTSELLAGRPGPRLRTLADRVRVLTAFNADFYRRLTRAHRQPDALGARLGDDLLELLRNMTPDERLRTGRALAAALEEAGIEPDEAILGFAGLLPAAPTEVPRLSYLPGRG